MIFTKHVTKELNTTKHVIRQYKSNTHARIYTHNSHTHRSSKTPFSRITLIYINMLHRNGSENINLQLSNGNCNVTLECRLDEFLLR